jgi:glycosyltransferase involved in cell wall biosynthesis
VLDLAEEQAKRGHEVGLLADSNSEDRLTARKLEAIAPLMKLGIARIPMSRKPGIGDIAAIKAVTAHARKLDLDVLHGHGAKGGTYARFAAGILNHRGQAIRAFYTPHGGTLNFKQGSLQAHIYMTIERALERCTSGLIFESAYAGRVYRERIAGRKAAERIIPNGLQPIDLTLAQPQDDATDLLFIGELRQLKGVDILLEAVALMNRKRRVTATIVGAGPDAGALKAQASALGLNDIVRFTGALPAREAMTLGRHMIVPSRTESFPYVVLEAAAAGLPLVATSVGGIPEIVAGTDTSLIEPDSVAALTTALQDMLDHPDEAAARARRLRTKVERTYTVEGMATAVLAFYNDPQSLTKDLPCGNFGPVGQLG